MSATAARPFPLVPRRRFLGVQFGRRRTLAPRRRRRDRRDAAVPARRPDRAHPLGRVRASLRGAGHRRVRRPRVLRRTGAARRARRRSPARRWRSTPSPSPWLDKRRAAESAARLIAASAIAEQRRARLQRRTHADAAWLRGRGAGARGARPARDAAPTRATPARCVRALDVLVRDATALPSGSFVFVVSDFLAAGADPGVGSFARAALGRDAGRRAGSRLGAVVSRRRRRCRAARRSGDGSTSRTSGSPARSARARCSQRGALRGPAGALPPTRLRSGADRHEQSREIADRFHRWAERRRRAWRMHS